MRTIIREVVVSGAVYIPYDSFLRRTIPQVAFQFSSHQLTNVSLTRFENILQYLLLMEFCLPFPSWWKQNGLEFE